jgi:menaquinone-dependent protoporphyrinogen IX oxidase
MRVLICFKSKHGATERYMQWLSEELGADVRTFDDIDRKYDFHDYDTVVVSSGTYAGFMSLNRFLKRHWDQLESKNVIAVAVGAALADDPWSLKSYNRIPDKIRGKIRYIKIIGDSAGSSRVADYHSPVKRENLNEVIDMVRGGK